MNRFVLFLFFLLLVSACARPAGSDSQASEKAPDPKHVGEGYVVVGNGGDYPSILREEGRAYALDILERLRLGKEAIVCDGYLSATECRWLSDAIADQRIRKDVAGSRHIPVQTLPAGCPADECACAAAPGVVYFAQEKCDATLHKRQDVAKLLIHESLHHLRGTDEALVKRLGVAVWNLWYREGHPDTPHWRVFSPPRRSGTGRYHAAWTGEKVALFDGQTLTSFDPRRRSWEESKWVVPLHLDEAANWRTAWIGGHLFLLADDFFPGWILSEETMAAGGIFSLAPARENAGSNRASDDRRRVAFSSFDHSIIAWTLEPTGVASRLAGERYDLSSRLRSWTPAAPAELIELEALTADSRVFFWGSSPTRADASLLYDATGNRWLDVAEQGRPAPRRFPILSRAGRQLAVYGGLQSGDELDSGALYDPDAKVWTPMERGPALGSAYRTVWTGTDVQYLGDRGVYAYNPYLNRWSKNDSDEAPRLSALEILGWSGTEIVLWDPERECGYFYYP